jgi:phosphoserine aminotransferase
MSAPKPAKRPMRPNFSSGPCVKPPGWRLARLEGALLGRYHRSDPGKARLREAIERTRALLAPPRDWLLAIVPASDTGAVEMAMWSLLGPRPVQLLVFEAFGEEWLKDARVLGLDAEALSAPYGRIPDLSAVRSDSDLVFPWNGTTSGARVPDGRFIPENREGLAICDATSAVFAQGLDWDRLDAVTFSWQKALGGEAAHGMLALGPRAVERLERDRAPRPLPKIFRLTSGGRLNRALFDGATINTPSMLCVEDWLACLDWAERAGAQGLRARADANADVVYRWAEASEWAAPLVEEPAIRSNTSVCIQLVDPRVKRLAQAEQRGVIEAIASRLEAEGAAFDILGHRAAPPGLRVWCGPTVEREDLEALTPWLDWAFAETVAELA